MTLSSKSKVGRIAAHIQHKPFQADSPSVSLLVDMEPFDEALSKRVQTLTETTEKLTEEAIINRKTVPSQRAAAIRRREALWADLELARLESRQQATASKENVRSAAPLNLPGEHRLSARSVTSSADHCVSVAADVPRRSDQKRALDAALTEVASLQIVSQTSCCVRTPLD